MEADIRSCAGLVESMNMDELGYSSFAMEGEVGCPFGVDLQKLLLAEPLTKFTTVFKVKYKYFTTKHV